MTTPTQAQRYAAAKAIRDVEEPEMPVSEFMKHAEAALTAAAEVRRLDLWKGTADPQVTRKSK